MTSESLVSNFAVDKTASEVGIIKIFQSALFHLSDHVVPHERNGYVPHVFSHRHSALLAGLLIAVKLFALASFNWAAPYEALSSAITPKNIFELTNASRTAYGLQLLSYSSVLEKAAQSKAEDMAKKSYFSHTSPDGRLPWDFIVEQNYLYLAAGENLAVNFSEAESVEEAWMKSPGHKANIVNKTYEELGVGVAEGEYQGRQALFVVQMFGAPAVQKVVMQEKSFAGKQFEETGASLLSDIGIENSDEPESKTAPASVMSFSDVQTIMEEGQIKVNAKVSGNPVAVFLKFGQRGAFLQQKKDGVWQGSLSLRSGDATGGLEIVAKDIKNNYANKKLIELSFSSKQAFGYASGSDAQVAGFSVNLFGREFNPKSFESRFYQFFIAGILSSMIMAFAARKHIKHLGVVANGSFVAILAGLFWMAG